MRFCAGIIAASAAVVVLAGCSNAGGERAASTPVPVAESSAAPGAGRPVVAEQLNFTTQLIDGSGFEGASLAGKDVVFWFWAPWCGECRQEAPHVAAVQKAAGDRVVFVGVAGRGDTADMQSFVDTYQVGGFTQIADTEGTVWQRFGIVQQPAFAFVSHTGDVEVVRGSLGEADLTARVDALTAP